MKRNTIKLFTTLENRSHHYSKPIPDDLKTEEEKKRLIKTLAHCVERRSEHIKNLCQWELKELEKELENFRSEVNKSKKEQEFILAAILEEYVAQFLAAREIIRTTISAGNN